jgi:catechol 2,3-dioxygenase-like lactoylglutathione lyase family enzyme
MISELHHVNITVSKADERAARTFYRDVVGLPEIPKPGAGQRGGAWYQLGGVQLHLSVEEAADNRSSTRHICILVPNLADAERTFRDAGVAILPDERPIEGWSRFYVCDPGGNRIEVAQQA